MRPDPRFSHAVPVSGSIQTNSLLIAEEDRTELLRRTGQTARL